MVDIPVIDVAPLFADDPAPVAEVAAAIGAACRGVGFFYVTGHAVTPALRDAAFAAARAFFALPAAAKERLSIARSPHNRGYAGLGTEQLDPAATIDRKEAFNVGFDLAADDPEVLAGRPFRGVNLWPDLPGWRATMLAYFDACQATGQAMHRAFAHDLGLSLDFCRAKIDRPMASLRMLRYPGAGQDTASGIGAGEHTDYGNITLLATDGEPGLEVRRRDGTWIDAAPPPGTLVCNIGDLLMRWTNDIYVSTPHRVRIPAGERYSLAYFLDPNPETHVAVLPSCLAPGEPPRYPPVTAADYLRSRLDATYIGPAMTATG
ncbi:isopenicillin N synthase family dioxygenase [Acidisphaera rubrifaciens]|uniref:2-oxoglutarate-dependent ethylene/succinate-forming enzyme n=1 Tax=Acidisphaera rubrifaciens HS-AP3 TaxID=1231350 RepID=A0A0D6P813_9PROT|nr:2-oxoglutarate and iron-dependent oxygenase domain-containing protein [Acidisphaera rubrifaciens]GAN77797.1 oxygenase 2OG-Fe(II) [Acidisphaera rubrifaciens HS-AP3]